MFTRWVVFGLIITALLFLHISRIYAEIPCISGKDGIVYLEMEARPVALELRPGVFFDAWGYCIKGEKPTVPGPTIKVREGTKVKVHFTNKLAVPASVHPHGVKYTAANDGAHIAGNPTSTVEPGHSRTYEWDTSGTPGTWFYHTHALEMGGDEGLYRGLWGALIIEPKEGVTNPPDKEFVVFMHSYMVNGTEYEAFNDKSGDIEFMNGDSSAFPGLVWKANVGEKVRFHVINTSEEMHTFHTHGHRWIDKASGELKDYKGK
jgi:FtsP/CotA-like multicopper oxidase with cupredoxin domain